MKDKKLNKTTKQLFALALVLVVLLGGTYAWLTLQVTGEKTNVLRAGTLSLVLDDTTSEGIKLEKAVPMSDEKGKTGTEYTFTLQNKGTKAASYTIYLEDVALETNKKRMEDSKVKYQLIKNSNESVALLSTLSDKVLDSGTIDESTTNTYSLRVWIDSAAETEVMGTILSKQLRVEATQAGTKNNSTTTAMCKRATILHGSYGSLGTAGSLSSGDAFDCDVNGDGVYDSDTERFYYVTDVDAKTAVLIYYNNVEAGVAKDSAFSAYDSSNENWHGPVTAIKQLPTTSQWKTTLTSAKRAITTETGAKSTTGGVLPTDFSYEGYAARFLTKQEIEKACNKQLGTADSGVYVYELADCDYFMENTIYNTSSSTYGWWLENPQTSSSNRASSIVGSSQRIDYNVVDNATGYDFVKYSVRPAIEVAKTSISY